MKADANEVAAAEKSVGAAIMADVRRNWNEHYQLAQETQRKELELARATASGQLEIDQAQMGLVRATLAQELEEHKITKDQETAALIKAENERYATEMKALDDEIATLGVGTVALQEALDKREALEIKHQTAILQIQTKGDKGSPFAALGSSVEGQFEGAFTSLTTKAQTSQQFLHRIFEEIASDFIHLAVRLATQNITLGSLQSIIGGGGDKAGTGNVAGPPAPNNNGLIPLMQKMIGGITALAGIAGLHLSVATSQLGVMLSHLGVALSHLVVGTAHLAESVIHTGILLLIELWTMLGAIFTAIFGATPKPLGFSGGGVVPSAAGGMVLPGGGGASLAILHPEEMVLPATLSKRVQNWTEPQDQTSEHSSPYGQGDDTHVHFHVNAIDAKGVADFFHNNHGHIADAMVTAKRNFHPAISELRR